MFWHAIMAALSRRLRATGECLDVAGIAIGRDIPAHGEAE